MCIKTVKYIKVCGERNSNDVVVISDNDGCNHRCQAIFGLSPHPNAFN